MTNENAINVLRYLSPPRTSKAAFDAFRQAIDMAIEALSQPEPHWIPVTDRLPNIREDVLISYYDEVMVGWLNDDGTWFAEECGRLNMNDIAAWMPLPEPWKGE